MSGVIYQNIKKLCSDAFSRKETLRFMPDSMPNFDQDFACRLSLQPPAIFTTCNFCSRSCVGKSGSNGVLLEKFAVKMRYLAGWQFNVSDSVAYFDEDFACRLSLRPPATSIPFTMWPFRIRPISIYCVRSSGISMEFAGKFTKISSYLAGLTMICGPNNIENPSYLAG